MLDVQKTPAILKLVLRYRLILETGATSSQTAVSVGIHKWWSFCLHSRFHGVWTETLSTTVIGASMVNGHMRISPSRTFRRWIHQHQRQRWWRTGWHRWHWCYNWLTAHNDYLEEETNGNVNKYLYLILYVYTKTRCQPNLYACLPISASTSAFGSQDLLFTFCPFVRDKKRKSAAINQKILRQTGHFHTQSP